jgi:hypothetical protein
MDEWKRDVIGYDISFSLCLRGTTDSFLMIGKA